MSLQDAIDVLVSTYDSLDSVARGLPVDAKEVADALAKATPDTAEFVALGYLAKYNLYVAPTKKAESAPVEPDPTHAPTE